VEPRELMLQALDFGLDAGEPIGRDEVPVSADRPIGQLVLNLDVGVPRKSDAHVNPARGAFACLRRAAAPQAMTKTRQRRDSSRNGAFCRKPLGRNSLGRDLALHVGVNEEQLE
jgi:hypothetical protein